MNYLFILKRLQYQALFGAESFDVFSGYQFCHLIENYLTTETDDQCILNIWFQQDGATSHRFNAALQFFHQLFAETIRNSGINI